MDRSIARACDGDALLRIALDVYYRMDFGAIRVWNNLIHSYRGLVRQLGAESAHYLFTHDFGQQKLQRTIGYCIGRV